MAVGEEQTVLNPATGMPFAPNVQKTSPQTSTNQVLNTPERQAFADKEQQAYVNQANAAQAEAKAEIDIAKQQAEAMRGQAQQDEAYAEERERMRRESQWRYEDARRVYESKMAEAMKDPGGYWDNKTSLDKVMTRIAITLGAFGAGDNKALNLINQEIDRDLKEKQVRSERLFKQAELARGYTADALRAKAEELADLDTHRAALWNIVSKRTEMLAKSGLAGKLTAQMQAKVAEIQNEAAKAGIKAQDTIATTRKWEGPKEVETYLLNQPGNKAPMNVIDAYTGAKQSERDLIAGAEAISNEKGFAEWQQAYRDALRTEIQSKGGFKGFTNFAQVIGAVEMNLADRLKTPEARAVNRAMIPITARTGRKLDDVGAMSDMTIDKAESSLGLARTTAGEMAKVARELASDQAARAQAIEQQYPTLLGQQDVEQPQSQSQQRPMAKTAKRPSVQSQAPADVSPPRMTREQMIAKARADAKAGGPKAESARAFLKRQGVTE